MDNEQNVRWLSYDEIADMRGIDRASAIRMVRRKHWQKRDANDGTTRVAVPGTFFRVTRTKTAVPGQSVTGQPPSITGQTQDNDNDNAPTINALLDHVRTLREQLGRERAALEGKAIVLREAVAGERERAERAEAEHGVARTEAMTERALRTQAEREREEARLRAALVEAKLTEVREAVAREARRVEQAEEARKTAETQRDAAQAARDATQAELAAWTAGGPLARTWRAFWNRSR
jgi:chromosome segregation ATPase